MRARLRASAASCEGVPQRVIAGELGVSIVTVGRWLREVPSAALIPVHMISPERVPSRFEVWTPRGLRVEGLDFDSLCALLERLG